MKKTRFTVIPRYSAGSPAQVDEATARKVAVDERNGYERTLEGIYGETAETIARARGIHGIVLKWREEGRGAVVEDLCTGESRVFRRFEEFQAYTKGLRVEAVR